MSPPTPFDFTDAPKVSGDEFVADIPAGLTSTQALLQALYDNLQLPGYFGFNWDALSDCLRDLHWIQQRRVVLRHSDLPGIPSVELRTYLEVLAEAKASWGSDEEHTLDVVFPVALRNVVPRHMSEGPEGPDPE